MLTGTQPCNHHSRMHRPADPTLESSELQAVLGRHCLMHLPTSTMVHLRATTRRVLHFPQWPSCVLLPATTFQSLQLNQLLMPACKPECIFLLVPYKSVVVALQLQMHMTLWQAFGKFSYSSTSLSSLQCLMPMCACVYHCVHGQL